MKKAIVALNIISIILFLSILSQVNIPSGITGFTTGFEKATFDFNPLNIPIFLFIFITLVLNIYFLLRK
jgi:hypothetical protein